MQIKLIKIQKILINLKSLQIILLTTWNLISLFVLIIIIVTVFVENEEPINKEDNENNKTEDNEDNETEEYEDIYAKILLVIEQLNK